MKRFIFLVLSLLAAFAIFADTTINGNRTISGVLTVVGGLGTSALFPALATGLVKNTTGTGAASIAVSSDITTLWSGTCPTGATCALGSTGTLDTVQPFPNSYLRGTFLGVGVNNSSSATVRVFPFSDSFALINACSGETATYWMHPIGGIVRNLTAHISGANGPSTLRYSIIPDCGSFTNTVTGPFTLLVPPGSAAGGFIDSWSTNQTDWAHVAKLAPLTFTLARMGGTNNSVISSIGAEFISDDATADSIVGTAQSAALGSSATTFVGFGDFTNATEANIALPWPIAATLKNLTFSNTVSPTNAATVTVRKNSADTAITLTIGAGDTAPGNYVDLTHTVGIVAGDLIDVSIVTGASTAPTLQTLALAIVPNDGTSAVLWGKFNIGTVTTTNKYSQPFSPIVSTTEANAEYTSPIACSLSHLYVNQISANGGGITTTFTLRKNEANTALTGTVGPGVTGSTLVDGTNSVAIVAGDRLSLQHITNTGTSGTMSGWSAQCN